MEENLPVANFGFNCKMATCMFVFVLSCTMHESTVNTYPVSGHTCNWFGK